jgi:8-hydroxy-5-deazaflavin:NADPH oxidoreductase
MKIGIIGSGIVGQVLAKAFTAEGHQVTMGTRDITKEHIVKFHEENQEIDIATFNDTARFGNLLVLATSGYFAADAVNLAGAENFAGKVIIDATNPITNTPPENGVLKFFTSFDESLMERLQKMAPHGKWVKAFNSVGNSLMYKPQLEGGTPTMFICGDDDNAKQTVKEILTAFGWETEDMGKATAARAIEPLCMLWCIPGFLNNDWKHAFKVLR